MFMFSITHATHEFQEHYTHVWQQYGGQSHHVDAFLTHKLRHTYGVLDATLRVVAGEPDIVAEGRAFAREAEIVALWHDIGRLYQVRGDRILGNKEYEHGNEAYAMLKNKYPDRLPLLLAIKIHNKFSYDALFQEDDYQGLDEISQKKALLLTKIIRDADKIQNLTYDVFDHFESLIAFDVHIYKANSSFMSSEISDRVIESFHRGEQVLHRDIRTAADAVLAQYSWCFDINFSSSRRILSSLGLHQAVCSALQRLGVKEELVHKIPLLV
ncbi:MAG: hypothetical protein NZL83_02225 [Candidatus Absconditabacterales bacterium]|nr:hypothetical protein [Candidatus Absconditabacterales bacterium]